MIRTILASLVLFCTTPALAGSGPWVLGDGEYSIYVGGESQFLNKLDTRDGAGGQDTIDVDQGISTLGAKAILTIGAQGRFEGELSVPYYQSHANRTDGPVCEALGEGSCDPTRGFGVIGVRGKGTVLDQLYGDPFTWAIGGDLRFGHLTAATRQRLTNLGEGTFDLGGFTSAGYIGQLGESYWSGFIEAGALYRVPNTRDFPAPSGTVSVPGAEFTLTSQVLLGLTKAFSVGPYVTGFARPSGLDFGETDLTDIDRFSSLKVYNLRVGGTVVLRAREGLSFSSTALFTPVAYNNPNTVLVSFGVGGNGLVRSRN